jgi:hypothetical protein
MSRLRKILPPSLLSVFVLAAGAANAVTFPVFDQMDSDMQAEFIADMVDRTEQALRDDGKPDLASKMEQLFAFAGPTDTMSVGLVELERNVPRGRIADLDRLAKDPNAPRLDVEDALFVTLKKNGIALSSNAMSGVINAMASFQQISSAEFRALPISQQRHVVQLFAETGFPAYGLRDALAKNSNGFFNLGEDYNRHFSKIASSEFPHTDNQPGFVHVAIDVEINNAKNPDAPVFYTVVLYVLKELRQEVGAEHKRLVDWSVLLPDGRHAYVDDNDDRVFWIMPDDNGAVYRLEANLQPLAQSLARCMEASGTADGARAQTACLERVANVRPSAGPDAAPVAPAAPSPSPVKPADDDDPIGGGGFITPPKR